MLPPLRIELWTAQGNAQLLNVAMSVAAARRVMQEAAPGLRAGDCIVVRDAAGSLVMASNENDRRQEQAERPESTDSAERVASPESTETIEQWAAAPKGD